MLRILQCNAEYWWDDDEAVKEGFASTDACAWQHWMLKDGEKMTRGMKWVEWSHFQTCFNNRD